MTLTAAGLLAAAVCASASAAAEPANDETRAIIIAPLLEEMNAAPGPALSLSSSQLDFSAAADFVAFAQAPGHESGAVRFARSGLLTRLSPDQRDSLAAFNGRRAVVATTPSGGQVSVSLHDGAAPDRLMAFQSPDYSEAMLGREQNRARNMAVRYQGRMDSPGGSGLDVGIAPRAGLGMGSEGPALEAGATLRVGRYLRDNYGSKPAWWFFAGADRQALLYNPRQGANLNSAVAFSPYAMVGDAQAGVAMRMGPADLSLAYVRRETEFSLPAQSWETVEDFAAFTLTMRR